MVDIFRSLLQSEEKTAEVWSCSRWAYRNAPESTVGDELMDLLPEQKFCIFGLYKG